VFQVNLGLVIETKALWEELQKSISDGPVRIVLEQSEIGDWPGFADKIERMRPDVLLIEVTNLREPLDEVIRRIKATSVAPQIFAVHTAADSQLILQALRSGASEYLFPPLGDQLRQALGRVAAERSNKAHAARPGGRVLAFVSAKGGCGATTVACHTGLRLAARTGQKVLLADFDLDTGMIGFLLKAKSQYSALDALRNVHRLDSNYWSALVSNGIPNLEVLSSPGPPASGEEFTAEQIRYVLRFGRAQYDWILVDLGRSLTHFSFRVVEEADETYLVTTLEVPALHQAKQIIQKMLGSGYPEGRLKVLLNRAPKRSEITLDELKGMLGVPIYSTISNDYAALNDSYSVGQMLPAGTALGRQFEDLAVRIAGIDTAKQKKKFSFFG
jgi:pilus assembly protein CpaE